MVGERALAECIYFEELDENRITYKCSIPSHAYHSWSSSEDVIVSRLYPASITTNCGLYGIAIVSRSPSQKKKNG